MSFNLELEFDENVKIKTFVISCKDDQYLNLFYSSEFE